MDIEHELQMMGQRIRSRREELGLSQEALATTVGYKSRTSINKIELGKTDLPQSMIAKIANALQTTPGYIMGHDEASSLPKNIIPMPKMHKIPLIGTIACGQPILAVEDATEEVELPHNIHADFALTCKGDSMINARIFDGDVVYIKSQPIVDNGDIAAVIIGEEATLKKVYYTPGGDRITLRPCNPMYSDMEYTKETLNEIKILGKAVAFTSLIRK